MKMSVSCSSENPGDKIRRRLGHNSGVLQTLYLLSKILIFSIIDLTHSSFHMVSAFLFWHTFSIHFETF